MLAFDKSLISSAFKHFLKHTKAYKTLAYIINKKSEQPMLFRFLSLLICEKYAQDSVVDTVWMTGKALGNALAILFAGGQ